MESQQISCLNKQCHHHEPNMINIKDPLEYLNKLPLAVIPKKMFTKKQSKTVIPILTEHMG